MLHQHGLSLQDQRCVLSGSGNVALYCTWKLVQLGAKVLTLSDSSGFIYDKEGFDLDKLTEIIQLKIKQRGRLHEYAERSGCDYQAGKRPWAVAADLVMPCATQNELNFDDAQRLISNGCQAVWPSILNRRRGKQTKVLLPDAFRRSVVMIFAVIVSFCRRSYALKR